MSCARFAMYMFTSCGWFFDDISGLEPVQNMRYADRAIELANSLSPSNRQDILLNTLEKALSNNSAEVSGKYIWQRRVEESELKPEQVAVELVLPASVDRRPAPEKFHCYTAQRTWWKYDKILNMHLMVGAIDLRHIHFINSRSFSMAIFYTAEVQPVSMVGPWNGAEELERVWAELEPLLQNLDPKGVVKYITALKGWHYFSMADLSEEARYALAAASYQVVLNNYRKSITSVYEEARETMRMFREMNLPLPAIFSSLAEIVIADRVQSSLEALQPDMPVPNRLNQLAMEARAMGLVINKYQTLEQTFKSLLEHDAESLYLGRQQINRDLIERINNFLDLCKAFNISPHLWRVQNYFHLLLKSMPLKEIADDLKTLVARLGMAVSK
jgi:hypothetical protein